ncbi:granulocyte colony-stimulating factor receptor isoform X1 [Anolis carolinensis]|uniref:granulocyte colony-stimulating factor receptor isoform X1 n=1 Tax=Anolis carolinensis TaxID=28377 RepID=UPI002F2B28EB
MATLKEPRRSFLGGAILFLLMPGALSLPCSRIELDAPVVRWGGRVSASCTVWTRHCHFPEEEAIQVMWRWNQELLAGHQQSLGNGVEISNITIGPLNRTVTTVSCLVKRKVGEPQFINLTRVYAGYPPSEPQNLTCIMNVTTKNLTCNWDPGQDSHLPDKIALHGIQTDKNCTMHRAPISPCVPPSGQSSCTIPRHDFQLYQFVRLWVSVENALGAVASRPLCADPMDLVKLDPPALQALHSYPEETDCVAVSWEGAEGSGRYMHQDCQLRFRTNRDQEWTLVEVPNVAPLTWKTQHCGFHYGTHYQAQMRCRRFPVGYWSEWSPPKNFTTHEKEPSGNLVTWWKMKSKRTEKGTEVLLMWKPMRTEETHGKILGYLVTSGRSLTLCNTTALHCALSLPPGTQRVLLSAYNSKGASPPTEVLLIDKKGQPVPQIQALPWDEKSIQVSWDPPGTSSPVAYNLEWHKVTSEDLPENGMQWMRLENGSTRQGLVQEDIQPFQRYNISVYPLYKDGSGVPKYVEAYTMQKAPSEGPKLHTGNITKSTASLYWEPIPVEKQNGFITSYTIFWNGTNEDMSSAVVNASVDTFTLRGLWPSRMYQVHIMASNAAGSTNGTTLTLHTKAMDDMDIYVVYLLVGLLLAMIIVLIFCFQKSKRMKTQFWPSVPDPANSSLGKWAPTILQEETPLAPKSCELSPVIISAIFVIETEEKKCLSCGKSDSMKALEDSLPIDGKEPFTHKVADASLMSSLALPASYINSPESVQYAKVVTEAYRQQDQAPPPAFYIRSDSTQPLLGDLTPSPKPYENLWFHESCNGRESGISSCGFQEEALLDFPLLQGLKVDGNEELGNFRRV